MRVCLTVCLLLAISSTSDSKRIEGTVGYPDSFPTTLPRGSCLIVELKNVLKDSSKLITYSRKIDPDKFRDVKYSLEVPDDPGAWDPVKSLGLSIYGFVNNGWCNEHPDVAKDIHSGDLVAKKQYIINVQEVLKSNETFVHGPTIELY